MLRPESRRPDLPILRRTHWQRILQCAATRISLDLRERSVYHGDKNTYGKSFHESASQRQVNKDWHCVQDIDWQRKSFWNATACESR